MDSSRLALTTPALIDMTCMRISVQRANVVRVFGRFIVPNYRSIIIYAVILIIILSVVVCLTKVLPDHRS